MTEGYSLLVSFTDVSASFVNGFEAGMLWQRMEAAEPEIDITIHADNTEVCLRMAAARGYDAEIEPESDGWRKAMFVKRRAKLTLVRGSDK